MSSSDSESIIKLFKSVEKAVSKIIGEIDYDGNDDAAKKAAKAKKSKNLDDSIYLRSRKRGSRYTIHEG